VDDVTQNLICAIAQLLDLQHSFFSVAVDCFHISVRSGTILPFDGSVMKIQAAQETARKKKKLLTVHEAILAFSSQTHSDTTDTTVFGGHYGLHSMSGFPSLLQYFFS
jgi:hypothetical protein